MSTKRRPLRVKLPSGARPEDVWTKLGWGLEQWRDAGYLSRQAGGERVYASCLERNSDDPFGYSDQRRLKVFGDFLDELQSGSACFLNVQGREGAVYEPPLHKALSADLPVPAPLRRVARGMLDKVTLWTMGNATGGPVGSACGADGGAGRPLGGEPPGGLEEGGGTCSGSGAGGSAGGNDQPIPRRQPG
ncbi:unnamed protein product [Prorocentrum cordatum]|uniref:Uncharacterized protein n=1 Tax=Prorocentrum cordatum TaxID=2364126 RepID=A0ABN9X270_9DINO|nr:unnamed protein product [Polarella glacialis]